MTAEYIYKYAKACEAVYGTRDAEAIFRQRHAKIKNTAPPGLRGLVCMVNGRVVVSIDEALSGGARRCTAARLLAHSLLHRKRLIAGEAFSEPSDLPLAGQSEREADLFAAELLIPDDEILALRDSGMSEGQIASSFGTMRELIQHKLFSMRSRGISVGDDVCRADFLKRCDLELFY